MAQIKHDLMNLEDMKKSMDSVQKIVDETTDESTYNVVTKEGNLLENVDFDKELSAIFESSKSIIHNYLDKTGTTKKSNPTPITPETDPSEQEIDSAFAILEAVASPEIKYENLKGKKVLLKNKAGKEMSAMVESITDKEVSLKGTGGKTNLSFSSFKKIFVGELEDKPIMESVETKETKKKPLVESEEPKETKVENLVKESSPVKDEAKVQVNPTGEPTEPGKLDFSKLPVVEHDEFVKMALAAKEDAKKKTEKNMSKPLEKSVEVKLLKHSDKFKDFVNSFKDEKNGALIECVLEGFGEYVKHVKARLESENKPSAKAICEGAGANLGLALSLLMATMGFSQEVKDKVLSSDATQQEQVLERITTELRGIPSAQDLQHEIEDMSFHDTELEKHMQEKESGLQPQVVVNPNPGG
jgi:hypothetical protein